MKSPHSSKFGKYLVSMEYQVKFVTLGLLPFRHRNLQAVQFTLKLKIEKGQIL